MIIIRFICIFKNTDDNTLNQVRIFTAFYFTFYDHKTDNELPKIGKTHNYVKYWLVGQTFIMQKITRYQ